MKKWADYLISKVRYDSENLISIAIRHQDTDLGITLGEPIDRSTITSDIKNGLSYITIYNGKNSWKKGHKIQTFSIGGIPYLRIDENKVKLDYLGDLPELLSVKSNSILEPEPENEQATPEQIEKLNQLQKQIEELETVPEPEPEPENEQATPEQITQLDDLQRQIDKLENMLSNPILFESKSAEEFTPEQISKVKKLEKEIKKLERVDTEYDIIQTLQKQNKKLDDIEKKLHDLEK
jgi:molecular chaperone DnaK (HSP70)